MSIKTIRVRKGKKILWKCVVADNLFSKAFGIMFKKKFKPHLFIFDLISPISIHSAFCQPFTAFFLDEKKRITQIKKMNPFSIFTSKPSRYFIEVPQDDKKLKEIKIGDILIF